jgi:hypothetical protein
MCGWSIARLLKQEARMIKPVNTLIISATRTVAPTTSRRGGIRGTGATDKSWAMSDCILTLRGRFAWAHDYDPAATFEGEFSNVTSSYAGKGVVRYQW